MSPIIILTLNNENEIWTDLFSVVSTGEENISPPANHYATKLRPLDVPFERLATLVDSAGAIVLDAFGA
jgi:hypothetical protein